MYLKNGIILGAGPVAQWIERLRPKEKVVRSTRTRVTIFVHNNRPTCVGL